MIDTEHQGRDLYLRTTDTDGRVTLSEHRVWDGVRFVLSRQADADRANEKARSEGKLALATAAQITREQFKASGA